MDATTFNGPHQIFINNQFVDAKSGKVFETLNPSTGKVLAKVAEGDAADIDAAVEAAHNAFVTVWKHVPGEGRAALMRKLADIISEKEVIEKLALIESSNNGLPISAARATVGASSLWLNHFAGYADKIEGKVESLVDPTMFGFTLLEPLGVIGAIVPWNFPIALLFWKVAPALACGNTIVVKPSEKTPLSTLFVAELFAKAGFPPGVFNVVPGYGPTAGGSLAQHNKVRKITFTGSVPTGRQILRDAANSNLKKVTLELGGKSPVIVCPDANIDDAVEKSHDAMFLNSGQVCVAGSRVFVHESVHDEFVRKAIERAKRRLSRVGPSTDDKTELTPVVDRIQFDRVQSYIQTGINEGATLATGGKAVQREGFFIEPTIFTNVNDDMKIAKEEIFGPVLSVFKYKTLDEAIKRANNTEYGLGAGVFTRSLNNAIVLSKSLESGTVWINGYGAILPQTPFGGYKQSGLGREGGHYVLQEYLQVKQVTILNAKL
jgi:acyl-CoA reductase-like NAD-dependent aldehyde dehydrogenase